MPDVLPLICKAASLSGHAYLVSQSTPALQGSREILHAGNRDVGMRAVTETRG